MASRWSLEWATACVVRSASWLTPPLAFATIVGVSTGVHAQIDDRPVVVVIDAGPSKLIANEVRSAIAAELGVKTIGLGSPAQGEARGLLVVSIGQTDVTIAYRDAKGGTSVSRTIALPAKQADIVSSIALLAGNLVRDQATPLLPPAASSSSTPEPSPGVTVAAKVEVTTTPEATTKAPPALPPAPPPPASTPTTGPAAAVRDVAPNPSSAEAPLYSDRWALALLGGQSTGAAKALAEANAWTIDLQMTRRFGWFSCGLLTGVYGAGERDPHTTDFGGYIVTPIAGSLELRLPMGPVLLEAGGAYGTAVYHVGSKSGRNEDGATPYARVMLTAGFALTDMFDFVARAHWSTTFRSIDLGGSTPLDAESYGLALGVRGHL